MSEPSGERRIGLSILALLAGFFFVVTLSLATDLALHAVGIFPAFDQTMSNRLLSFATAYRTIYSVAGSYLTARLAPNRPMQHALLGGVIGMFLAIVGTVVTWNKAPQFGPHWYPVALIVLAMPQAWLGGFLYRKA